MNYLIPIGGTNRQLLQGLRVALQATLGTPFEVLQPLLAAPEAWDGARKASDAFVLLEQLRRFARRKLSRDAGDKVLGIYNGAIFSMGAKNIFGEGENPGRCAIISLAPLRQGLAGGDGELFFDRAVKEALHELSHTYGMPHCPHPRCVMFFSCAIDDTDRKPAGFCPECEQKLRLMMR